MQYSYGSGRNNAGKPIVAYSSIDDYPVFGHFDNVYEYHRSILSDKEKILYDEIVESYLQFKPDLSTSLNTLTTEELHKTFKYVILDHPEIFWIDKYASSNFYDNVLTNKKIKLYYYYSEKEALKAQNSIQEKVDSIIQEAKTKSTDRDKIKFVHDKLIEIGTYTDYNIKNEGEFQSYLSIFQDGKTVCSGFAYGFKYIMDNLGIRSIIIADINEEPGVESHIWNMVIIDDHLYNLDITYDDRDTEEKGETSYNYYLVDNGVFYLTHEKQEDVPSSAESLV